MRDCKVCLNCIQKLHTQRDTLKPPESQAPEISSLRQPSLDGALLSIILSGFLAAVLISKSNISQVNFPLIFAASICFALIMNLASNYFTSLISKETAIEALKHFGYTHLPLILFGFLSLKAIDVFGNVEGSLMLFNIYKLSFNFTTAFQLLMVLTGLFITEYLVSKIIQNKITKTNNSGYLSSRE